VMQCCSTAVIQYCTTTVTQCSGYAVLHIHHSVHIVINIFEQ